MKTETIRDIEASIEKGYKDAEMHVIKGVIFNYWNVIKSPHCNKTMRDYADGLHDAALTMFLYLIWDGEEDYHGGVMQFSELVNSVGKEYGFLKEGK